MLPKIIQQTKLMKMSDAKCPFCGKFQTKNPVKEWGYSGRKVSRYDCKCGKSFNFFIITKGKSWTIPKPKSAES